MQPATFYHIYNHAVGNENLFRKDENYDYFLAKYASYIPPIADTYAYCLMPNHIHFLVRVKSADELRNTLPLQDLTGFKNLSGLVEDLEQPTANIEKRVIQQFNNLFNSYSKAYNKTFNRMGTLFVRAFKRKAIENNAYLTQVIHYIHNNPVHHGFVNHVAHWTYSSYGALVSNKPSKLERVQVLEWFGGKEKFAAYHQLPIVMAKDGVDII